MGLHTVRESIPWEDPVRRAPAFLEVTGATLLVGRIASFRGTGQDLLALWDEWSARMEGRGCAVPAHDLSRFEEYAAFDGRFRVALGAPIADVRADDGPSDPVEATAIAGAIERAASCLDERTLDRVARDLAPRDAWSLRIQRTRALLVPFGPIASAYLARGRPVRADDPIAPGAVRVRGADMRQRRHELAIDGELLAAACHWDVAEPILRAPARGGSLHLVARYG